MSLLPARRPERAFECLYRRYVVDVYRYALVVLREPDSAESATQAAFVTALHAYKRGERPRKPVVWLLGIAHDVCSRFAPPVDHDELEPWDPEATPTASDIRRAFDRVSFAERSAFALHEAECQSHAEIAEVLGLQDDGAEALIFRARRALREQLGDSLICDRAERAISRSLDTRLPRAERKLLRVHLRVCPECVAFERIQRGSRAALRAFGAAPVPDRLRVASLPLTHAPGALVSAPWES